MQDKATLNQKRKEWTIVLEKNWYSDGMVVRTSSDAIDFHLSQNVRKVKKMNLKLHQEQKVQQMQQQQRMQMLVQSQYQVKYQIHSLKKLNYIKILSKETEKEFGKGNTLNDNCTKGFKKSFIVSKRDFENEFEKYLKKLLKQIASIDIEMENVCKTRDLRDLRDTNTINHHHQKQLEQKIVVLMLLFLHFGGGDVGDGGYYNNKYTEKHCCGLSFFGFC